MLADSRIDKVIGRMMFLVSSIITMKFIRAIGVPVGTVWASILFVLFNQPKIIIANHIDRAVGSAIIICAVGVKVKGDRAMKFIINRDRKVISMVLEIPLCLCGFINDLSSFSRGSRNVLIMIIHLIEFFFLIDKIKVKGIIIEIQTMDIVLVDGSKIENKLFIIFRLCFLNLG